jgi:hypothetical protein
MRYVAILDGQWVALVGFGSAVLSCAARDQWIGWSRQQQYTRLRYVANNQRFCVLPGEPHPNLASAVLARVLRRVAADYVAVYGHRVVLVETFTDPARHTGACYRAANFIDVGATLGYSRSGGSYQHHGQPKRVWLYPLHRHTQHVLSTTFDHPLLTLDRRGVDLNMLPITGDGGLLAVCEKVTDPRKKRGVRHKAAAILTMVAGATLAGHRSFRSVGDWVADLPQDALARLGARRHPVTGKYIAPSEATIRRTVKDIDANEADALICGWLFDQVIAGRLASDTAPAFLGLACDGKTLKGSWPEINTANSKVRLFSALVHGEGVVVGQRAIPADTTEVTQMLPLIDTIAANISTKDEGGTKDDSNTKDADPEDDPPVLDGIVITADALHVHRDNMQGILDRGGHYALTVKKNQPTLRTQLEQLFPDADSEGDFPPAPHHI